MTDEEMMANGYCTWCMGNGCQMCEGTGDHTVKIEEPFKNYTEYRAWIKNMAKQGIWEAVYDDGETEDIIMGKYLYEQVDNHILCYGNPKAEIVEGIPLEYLEQIGYKIVDGYVINTKINEEEAKKTQKEYKKSVEKNSLNDEELPF